MRRRSSWTGSLDKMELYTSLIGVAAAVGSDSVRGSPRPANVAKRMLIVASVCAIVEIKISSVIDLANVVWLL